MLFGVCPVCGRYHPYPLEGWWCPMCGKPDYNRIIHDLTDRLTVIEKTVEWGTQLTDLEE